MFHKLTPCISLFFFPFFFSYLLFFLTRMSYEQYLNDYLGEIRNLQNEIVSVKVTFPFLPFRRRRLLFYHYKPKLQHQS